MLGVVAAATAWSGYQAAHWGGVQSTLYAKAGALRVESTRDSTLAADYKLYDVTIVNNWINAYTQGKAVVSRDACPRVPVGEDRPSCYSR